MKVLRITRFTRPGERRMLVRWFVWLYMFALAANLVLAVSLMPSNRTRTKTTFNVIGPEAAPLGWPYRTPHAQPWPDPTQWQSESAWLGHREIGTWSATPERTTTHQMQVNEYGWPLATLRQARLWWPWEDPAWTSSAPTDTGLRLVWAGVFVNPLFFGGSLWLVFLVLPFVCVLFRRALRARRGLCIRCAYPVGVSEVCTECGAAVERGAEQADPTARDDPIL